MVAEGIGACKEAFIGCEDTRRRMIMRRKGTIKRRITNTSQSKRRVQSRRRHTRNPDCNERLGAVAGTRIKI